MQKKLLICSVLLYILYGYTFEFLRVEQFDKESFIAGARLLFDLDGGANLQARLSKPLYLFFPGLLEKYCNIHPEITFNIQNTIAFFLIPILIFKTTVFIHKNETHAFYCALAYMTCNPFIVYTHFLLSDICGWFCIALGCYYCITKVMSPKIIIAIAALNALSCFVKESAIVAQIFLLFTILFSDKPVKAKASSIVIGAATFMIFFFLITLSIEYFLQDSIFGRVNDAYKATAEDGFSLNFIKQMYRAFDVYWILFVWTIFLIFNKKIKKDTTLKVAFCTTISTLILCNIWPYYIDRIYFITAFPFVMLLSYAHKVITLYNFKTLVIIGGILNFLCALFIYKFHIPNLIATAAIIYLIIILLLLKVNPNIQKTT